MSRDFWLPLRSVHWWRAFWPVANDINWKERLRIIVGIFLGIALSGLLTHQMAHSAWPWLVAPMGASAVLIFGVPSSPLAQPWAVIGSNTISALFGILCVHLLGSDELAAAVAVAGATGLMLALRCLHPPGGAAALLVTLSGTTDPLFAFQPVMLNSVLLVLVGMAYNTLTRREYPHRPKVATSHIATDHEEQALEADLNAVLARHNQVIDISHDELKSLLNDVRMQTYERKLNQLLCAHVMTPTPLALKPQDTIAHANSLLHKHRIKSLPVTDSQQHVIGIVTRADLTQAADQDRVLSVMSRRVQVISMGRHLSEVLPLFRHSGHHHIPVIDAQKRLVGMLTQSDVLKALMQITAPAHELKS